MIKSKLTITTLLSLVIVLSSCSQSTKSETTRETTMVDAKEQLDKTAVDAKASEFVEHLKAGEQLSSFFKDKWVFVYHEYSRCDGSTDGQIANLKNTQIDTVISLQLENDGDGWAHCDEKKAKSFEMDFDLKKKIKQWDRLEIPKDESQEQNIVYVLGLGESDYLKLHYNDSQLIVKLAYRSEDPG